MKKTKRFYVTTSLVSTVLLLLAIPAGSQTRITEEDLRPPRANRDLFILPDGDVISVKKERAPDVPRDLVEIVFSAGPSVTWWKAIQAMTPTLGPNLNPGGIPIRDVGGPGMPQYSTQDNDRGPKRFRVLRDDLSAWGITFSKAKFLGAHTKMYSLSPRVPRSSDIHIDYGFRLTFVWEEDSLPSRPKTFDLKVDRQYLTDRDSYPSNRKLPDGDEIAVYKSPASATFDRSLSAVGPDEVQIVFTKANITWWKELKIRLWTASTDGVTTPIRELRPMALEGSNDGPVAITLKREELARAQFIFSKAKLLGAHTEVYRIWGDELGEIGNNNRVRFLWQKD